MRTISRPVVVLWWLAVVGVFAAMAWSISKEPSRPAAPRHTVSYWMDRQTELCFAQVVDETGLGQREYVTNVPCTNHVVELVTKREMER